jgi:hypothetical protein
MPFDSAAVASQGREALVRTVSAGRTDTGVHALGQVMDCRDSHTKYHLLRYCSNSSSYPSCSCISSLCTALVRYTVTLWRPSLTLSACLRPSICRWSISTFWSQKTPSTSRQGSTQHSPLMSGIPFAHCTASVCSTKSSGVHSQRPRQ